jgi:hypothetical protein
MVDQDSNKTWIFKELLKFGRPHGRIIDAARSGLTFRKKMKSALLIVALIACAASKFGESDPFEVFLTQLGRKGQQIACQNLTQSLRSGPGSKNTFQSCLRDTYPLTAETISEFRPIALKVIDEAVSDSNQLDPHTKPAPSSIDGDTEDARKLCVALDHQYKLLVNSKFRGFFKKESEGILSKRRLLKLPKFKLPKFKLPKLPKFPKFPKQKGASAKNAKISTTPNGRKLRRINSSAGEAVNRVARILGLAGLKIFYWGMMVVTPMIFISLIFAIMKRVRRRAEIANGEWSDSMEANTFAETNSNDSSLLEKPEKLN